MMTPGQAAKYLQISRSTLYHHLRAGLIPATKIGKLWRISREGLEGWKEERVSHPERMKTQAERGATKAENKGMEMRSLLEHMDSWRKKIGPVGAPVSEFIKEGRTR